MEKIFYDNDLISNIALDNFGIKYLFPWQRFVISNILEAYDYKKKLEVVSAEEKLNFEKENSDSFCLGRQIVLLPTGAGKSLCFQIPAFILDGPTLVIYPLLALMTDQQRRMESGSLKSVVFRGGLDKKEKEENFRKIKEGAKIIIANPEVLQSESLVDELAKLNIAHVAIDEAHCVSEWGDSFRPSYLKLGEVLKKIKAPLITAFTATASSGVLERISEILFEKEAHVVRSESDRPNIHYYVRYGAVKEKLALELANTELHPMIIFCGTRNKAEEMALALNVCYGKDSARFYHAGLERDEKEATEKWFFQSKDGILCATCAYGMGVDKKDIKTVIHLESSETAEAYIQEAGRGGRDGSIAKAILLWSPEDSINYGLYKEDSRQAMMKTFAETKKCRRQVLLDALGGEQAYCSGCDNCNENRELDCINKMHFIKRKIAYRNFIKRKCKSDEDEVCKVIRKNKNFYSEETLCNLIFTKMNDKSRKIVKKNIWTHYDAKLLVETLKLSGRLIQNSRIFGNTYRLKK